MAAGALLPTIIDTTGCVLACSLRLTMTQGVLNATLMSLEPQ